MSFAETEIMVKSSLDGTLQPSLFFEAEGSGRPLLVGLHTWSFDRFNQVNNMLPYAKKYNFHLLLPEFRGANVADNPNCREACGSPYAIGDIFDAIKYVAENYSVDTESIFLLGQSGGGHAALMCCAENPTLFRAAAAFVPVCDLADWSEQNSGYRASVVACCGNAEEMKRRSPSSYAEKISQANLKIFHGKFDPVVPFMQSVNLYNTICKDYPKSRVFLDIFDGGHEIDMQSAFYWFESQLNGTNLTEVTG
jgi:predicted esterase